MMSISLIEQLITLSGRSNHGSSAVTYSFCQNADYQVNTVEVILKGLMLRLYEAREETRPALRPESVSLLLRRLFPFLSCLPPLRSVSLAAD
jgi:hypothetical protein